MQNTAASRFLFIAHALNGDGPFRPQVTTTGLATSSVVVSGSTYLVRYPRESDDKFARRNELAFYSSPLQQAASRFVGYLTEKPPIRTITNDLYKVIADDADGKGNAIDLLWQDFMVNAKARGTMLLLVDMPSTVPNSLADQIKQRSAPYLTQIKPEDVTEYELGQDGKFNSVSFKGSIADETGATVACVWTFTRSDWKAIDAKDQKKILSSGEHNLGQCPVLIFTERGDFPCFGPFSPIADLSKRLFNLDSELDEILRAQTFSLLTMQVPKEASAQELTSTARIVGETVSTQNVILHSGATPAFIAPPDGPASIYMQRITDMRQRINDVGLSVQSTSEQYESGIALQMRFHTINSELSKFSSRMEDFERNVWELCRRWLNLTQAPQTSWNRDFTISDVEKELQILRDMNANAMPREVTIEQQKRIVSLQFAGSESQDEMLAAVDAQSQERITAPDGA